jgi:hypothetical protein
MGLCRNPMSTVRSEPGKLVGGEVDRALHPSELDYSLEPRCVSATEQITPFAVPVQPSILRSPGWDRVPSNRVESAMQRQAARKAYKQAG